MHKRPGPAPREAPQTARQALRRELELGPHDALELSALLGLTERDVVSHLEHLGRSLQAHGIRLLVEPAQCRECGYRFETRARLSRPGACPRCRSGRIAPPRFSLASWSTRSVSGKACSKWSKLSKSLTLL